ncbi:MAG: hypothetical protein N4A45_10885 [Flavobacteriales bacterium]|jgi:hypothetical protein|nr:hypothetical protein [Flavobacteriales bacterium]
MKQQKNYSYNIGSIIFIVFALLFSCNNFGEEENSKYSLFVNDSQKDSLLINVKNDTIFSIINVPLLNCEDKQVIGVLNNGKTISYFLNNCFENSSHSYYLESKNIGDNKNPYLFMQTLVAPNFGIISSRIIKMDLTKQEIKVEEPLILYEEKQLWPFGNIE